MSIRALAERHHVHRRTVRQALADALPPLRKAPVRAAPVLGPHEATVRRGAGPAFDQVSGSTKVSVAANVAYLSFEYRQEVYAFPTAGCGRSTCLPLNVLRLGSSSSGGFMSAVTVAEGTAAVAVSGTGIVALRTD